MEREETTEGAQRFKEQKKLDGEQKGFSDDRGAERQRETKGEKERTRDNHQLSCGLHFC